ncbi:MAG TPA: hypothetical protein PKH54_12195 [Myxococcota bacterium]|nr:hypothetical protein [Myxococcota bacterium]HOA12523.1 hypothetical protein [Myxococcota bacterium]HOD00700.1 hypothetical protein [Myxococcota bacterium]HOH75828.1 hypothetical protein [Myxococcota bacterium]
MTSKLKEHISEAINESKKQVQTIIEKGTVAAGVGREVAGKAIEKAEDVAAKARAKAGETAAKGAVAVSVISEKVQKDNLVKMAESVRDEVRNTLFAETMSEIARLKDDTDELRRRMADMQKAYDRKIADLQDQIKAAGAEKPTARTARTKRAETVKE